MILAVSLHFLCVSGLETHEKCNEIALSIVLCYIKIVNVPSLYATKYSDWCNFVAFYWVSGPETHRKCNENAPIIVLYYIKIGNVPKLCVIKYNDWCNFAAFFVRFRP